MTNRRQMSVAGMCVALLIALVASSSHSVTASDTAAAATVYAVSGADITSPDCSPAEELASKRSHRTGWGRDPFQHPHEKMNSPIGGTWNGARLVGIVGGRKGRMAIFGHSVLQKGDMVGNEMIVEIDQNRVTVTRDGFRRIIAMQEAR